MNLKDQLLTEHSRSNCDLIASWIGEDPKRFEELLQLFLGDNYRITQRAVWPLCEAARRYPSLVEGHLNKIIALLKNENIHDAVKRNTTRLFQMIPLPEVFEGELMEICFNYVLHPKETVAVKVNALVILEKMAIKYPEIIPELKLIIHEQMPWQSRGFKSRGKKILAKFG